MKPPAPFFKLTELIAFCCTVFLFNENYESPKPMFSLLFDIFMIPLAHILENYITFNYNDAGSVHIFRIISK